MDRPTILSADQALSALATPDRFSVLSYNILLPNSIDGWWIYKYYDQSTPAALRAWPHRQALLQQQMMSSGADIICVQEASASSFDTDLGFLGEAGFEHVLHKKYQFRCATFWRRDRFTLIEDRSTDRVLLTTLQARSGPDRQVHVLNCHLSGGPSPARRFRQVFDALDRVRKRVTRLKQTPTEVPVIVCGDFNSFPGETGLERLLQEGSVSPEYREPGYPEQVLTSRVRGHPFGRFADTYLHAYGSETARPATLIAPMLADRFFTESGDLTQAFVDALRQIFDRFAADGEMNAESIAAWLTAINQRPDRGSEHRKTMALLEEKGRETLRFEDFLEIYESELRERKYWSVHHDLQALGVGLAPKSHHPYAVCLDRIYANPALEPIAVRAPLSEKQQKSVYEELDALPNAWHPSDHLPLGAVLQWRS